MKYIICVLSIILFSSCDPVLSIEIENETDQNAQVIWSFNQVGRSNNYKFDDLFPGNSNTRIDSLFAFGKVSYVFGIGTWEMAGNLDSLSHCIEQVVIKSKSSTIIYQGKGQIKKFLQNAIVDKPRSVISIEIK